MKYKIIDTAGQLTAIFTQETYINKQAAIGKKLLSDFPTMGQVAFISFNKTEPLVRMMGGELSINGSIAAAFYCSNKLRQLGFNFCTSPLPNPVSAIKTSNLITISLPDSIVEKVSESEVTLTGIKYRLINSANEINKLRAREYCGNELAAGFIVEIKPGEIIPIVYVKETDTLITETACGSASLAYSLLTGYQKIIQPSGSVITITRSSGTLSISTECKEIYVKCTTNT